MNDTRTTQPNEERSLVELLAASPKFNEALQDLKRLEKYMTPLQKKHLVRLVKEAMGAR